LTIFELNRLLDYDEQSIIAELRRVANLITTPALTGRAFDRASKVDSSTIRRRFGGWRNALEKAGLGHRYSGAVVTERMKKAGAKKQTNQEIIDELKRVAAEFGLTTFTAKKFDAVARFHSATAVRRFGSWAGALTKAGLIPGKGARRYTEDDYFENLLNVWTHYGRQPKYSEMDLSPSIISSRAYEAKWGKWTNALRAFLKRMESDTSERRPSNEANTAEPYEVKSSAVAKDNTHQERGPIKLGVRYDVLKRNRFRCVICGASPATDPTCQLHVDHILPRIAGGPESSENLRTLCARCNIGKGPKLENIS
jgi:5-methylcytosine-specific restriction endonuclease McrA